MLANGLSRADLSGPYQSGFQHSCGLIRSGFSAAKADAVCGGAIYWVEANESLHQSRTLHAGESPRRHHSRSPVVLAYS